jgi:hypothetical protein
MGSTCGALISAAGKKSSGFALRGALCQYIIIGMVILFLDLGIRYKENCTDLNMGSACGDLMAGVK